MLASFCQELYTPSSGYRLLQSRLKIHWNIQQYREELSLTKIASASLLVFGLPREMFSIAEVFTLLWTILYHMSFFPVLV